MEIEFENKKYKGVVNSIRLAALDNYGNSTYEFNFSGGKQVFYTQKSKLPQCVQIGDTVEFSGFFNKDKFIIDVLHSHYNEQKLLAMYGQENMKKIIAMGL